MCVYLKYNRPVQRERERERRFHCLHLNDNVEYNGYLLGNSHQRLSVANMIELLLKSFFGVSLAYVRSLEGSQKAG